MNVSESERSPLLSSSRDSNEEEGVPETSDNMLDRVGLRCLLIQHCSSAWIDGLVEFAPYLYLIIHFKDTLLPSSLFGFSMTATGVILSRYAGSLLDKYPKLPIVRFLIVSQKISAISIYACCAIMIVSGPASSSPTLAWMTPSFIWLLFSACLLQFSNIAVSIAIERDWASRIAKTSLDSTADNRLAQLNTYLRQITLLCRFCAPFFVSTLTVKLDSVTSFSNLHAGSSLENLKSVWVLIVITAFSLVFEIYWIGVVYRRFPSLALDQALKDVGDAYRASVRVTDQLPSQPTALAVGMSKSSQGLGARSLLSLHDWKELIRLPIFFSSVSISCLYLTVLSFDGIMVSYLKILSFSDDFIAEMRGISVVTGLLGTAIAAPLERKIGSVRAGIWSIWSMVFTLVPVLICFYMFAMTSDSFIGSNPKTGILGGVLLFGGIALSRVGLSSFDLVQMKQLQNALLIHPRRNTLTGLQFTMQNVMDLAKYILTMILYRPSQFRWAATVSLASILTGAIMYMVYAKKVRGHSN